MPWGYFRPRRVKKLMRPCSRKTSAVRPNAPDTGWAPHDHWPVDAPETGSRCRCPDADVLRENAPCSVVKHDAETVHQTVSSSKAPRIARIVSSARRRNDVLEYGTILPVAVMDEILARLEKAPFLHGFVAGNLRHPGRIGVRCDAGNVHPPSGIRLTCWAWALSSGPPPSRWRLTVAGPPRRSASLAGQLATVRLPVTSG